MRTRRPPENHAHLRHCSNAFKFTAKGEVRASVNVANEPGCLRVQDTGIGIAAEQSAGVRRVPAGRRHGDAELRRLRLGLALARGLARLLGGDIELDSAPGDGSTFLSTFRSTASS